MSDTLDAYRMFEEDKLAAKLFDAEDAKPMASKLEQACREFVDFMYECLRDKEEPDPLAVLEHALAIETALAERQKTTNPAGQPHAES